MRSPTDGVREPRDREAPMTDDARRPSYGSGWIGLRFSRIRGRPRGPRAGEEKWAWLFIAPMVIGLLLLSAAPILATFAISLTHWDLLTAPDPAGLDNYAKLGDPRFLTAIRNTAFYTIVSAARDGDLAGLALALNQAIAGISWIRTMYFLPIVTSTIAVGLVWSWIYSPSNGLLNQLLACSDSRSAGSPTRSGRCRRSSGCRSGRPAGQHDHLPGRPAGDPDTYYDAASVDGAGRWARPGTSPAAADAEHLLHRPAEPDRLDPGVRPGLRPGNPGKPTSATITIVYFIYEAGFRNFKMGYASAASWILFLVVAVLTFIYFRSQNRCCPTSEGRAGGEPRASRPSGSAGGRPRGGPGSPGGRRSTRC